MANLSEAVICARMPWIGERGVLASVLDVLESHPRFAPERFGVREGDLKPYSRKTVLAMRPRSRLPQWFCMFVRRAPSIEVVVACGPRDNGTNLILRAKKMKEPRPLFDLADALARRMEPLVMSVALSADKRAPSEDPKRVQTINSIIASGSVYEPWLQTQGLVGLAARTYFGPELVELVGKKRILSLKLSKEWLGDTVRIDLVDEPWKAAPEEMVKPWREAMAILAKSKVFSTVLGMTPNGTILPRTSQKWSARYG